MRKLALIGLIGAALVATPVAAGELDGVWFTQSGDTKVKLYQCGSNYCGKIVWLKKPQKDAKNEDKSKRSRNVVGIKMINNAKPQGGGEYKGKLYNYDDGKTYTGVLKKSGANRLKLSGCVWGGLICKSQTWKRAN